MKMKAKFYKCTPYYDFYSDVYLNINKIQTIEHAQEIDKDDVSYMRITMDNGQAFALKYDYSLINEVLTK